MIIYPAIDLIDGQCVRLHKGDFNQKTTYNASPIEVAKDYQEQGAEWLHLVDLDGARDPENRQIPVIQEIIQATGLKVQTGGGIRHADDVAMLLEAGASRIVIGSLCVKNPEVTKDILQKFGTDKICLAMDVLPKDNQYFVAVSGWQEESNVLLNDLINDYMKEGLKHVLCTDISRDGAMTGSNIKLYQEMQKNFPTIKIQASGGVKSLDDIRELDSAGVIIGKALYENIFTVREALEAA